jgi:hypothetical protein
MKTMFGSHKVIIKKYIGLFPWEKINKEKKNWILNSKQTKHAFQCKYVDHQVVA